MTVEQLWQPAPGGSGTYVHELVRALDDLDDVDVVPVAARGHTSRSIGGRTMTVQAHRLPRTALYEAWNRLRWPATPPSGGPVDVVHATTWAVPPRSAPLVVTVHDVAFLHEPDHFTARGNSYFRRALEVVRREADAIVVPSQATADDCAAVGLDLARVHVVPHGVRVPRPSAEAVADLARRHGLERPYVLWCGTLEPRKNLPALLDAFAAVADRHPDLALALAGPDGWGDAAEQVALRWGQLPADRVVRLGRLSHDDLHAAYAGARAFCFPSLREGFGMPVLEAMAHGVPVVTSAGTPMVEFTQGAGLLVDPTDVDALADALDQAVGVRHDELAGAAAARAADRSWARAAALTADVYRQVAR
ncbi:MAG: glycosyltransferase family 4 protein [Cellulomonas sp.]|nr:glycosyltransferase family 4 protein [Cellulomonas sp.]